MVYIIHVHTLYVINIICAKDKSFQAKWLLSFILFLFLALTVQYEHIFIHAFMGYKQFLKELYKILYITAIIA